MCIRMGVRVCMRVYVYIYVYVGVCLCACVCECVLEYGCVDVFERGYVRVHECLLYGCDVVYII